jgi:glucose/arabinose dehydrogenase
MFRLRLALAGAALFVPGGPLASAPAGAMLAVPSGFVDELVVGGLDAPTNSTFLPDGRMLVVEQYTGWVRLVVGGGLAAIDPVGVVTEVRSGGEAGLLGVAVDPGFPARPYVYVHATHAGSSSIRLWRYTLTGDLAFTGNGAMALDPASRYTVLAGLPDSMANHNGGTLRFGSDGMLFVALGDDDTPCRAQDLTRLQGKILRLDVSSLPPGGGGPPPRASITPSDNPFAAHADSAARLVWALGLRNPFSFTIDAPSGCLFVGDVGSQAWEEIDVICAGGGNYGWPHWEAGRRTGLACAGADTTAMLPPAHAYPHVGPGWAVFSGPLYRAPAGAGSPYPPAYEGTHFYGDTWKGFVRRLVPAGAGWAPADSVPGQPGADDWAGGTRYITSLHVAPDGSLVYTILYRVEPVSGPGELRRIRHVAGAGASDPPATAGIAFLAAHPSPARRSTAVELAWRLGRPSPVTLRIHDVRGRVVRTLLTPAAGLQPGGEQRLAWDGRDGRGRTAPAGIYVARIEAAGASRSRRLVRL